MRSINFWQHRYNIGGTSGRGSTGELLKFKVDFINNFIKEKNINSILDFGHGDCSLAKEIDIDTYWGVDGVQEMDRNKEGFKSKNVFLFYSLFNNMELDRKFEATMSIDVLYHILEDEINYLYKTLDNMYEYSNKYIIVYAQNSYLFDEYKHYNDPKINKSVHMYNCPWRQYFELTKYKNKLKLIYEQENPQPGCDAKFFIYEKV